MTDLHLPNIGYSTGKEFGVSNANDTFALSEAERTLRKGNIANLFGAILDELGIDRNDPNAADTPNRVAKMFVDEIFAGRFQEAPKVTVFPNTRKIDEMIVTGPLTVRSMCSHHFMPIVGRAWIGYIPDQQLLGLSKFPRLLEWFARRPQIQEELTQSLANYLQEILNPKGLAVYLSCSHFCQSHRGVNESSSSVMTTSVLKGGMLSGNVRQEFLSYVTNSK